MPSDAERLRKRTRDNPCDFEGWLALGNALFRSEAIRDWVEALSAYRAAEKLGQAHLEETHSRLLGPDGKPLAKNRSCPLPELEWTRCRMLMRRITARVTRDEGEKLPGLHPPMDADRNTRPRGVSAEGWDALGTRADFESFTPMEPMSREESNRPLTSPLGPLRMVPGERDEEGIIGA